MAKKPIAWLIIEISKTAEDHAYMYCTTSEQATWNFKGRKDAQVIPLFLHPMDWIIYHYTMARFKIIHKLLGPKAKSPEQGELPWN